MNATTGTDNLDERGWFKARRFDDGPELLRKNRNAFGLLYIIASRARWREGFNQYGLAVGEAFLGDHTAYGMSERESTALR